MAALVVFSLTFAVVFFKRTKYREKIEEWEQDFFGPIDSFTRNSASPPADWGFGKVYMGILPSKGQEITVKCITKEFREGMKGFVRRM